MSPHGITKRYCHHCAEETIHVIGHDKDLGLKVYICTKHNGVSLKQGAD